MGNRREETRAEADRLRRKLVDLTVALEGHDREVADRAALVEECELQQEQAQAALSDVLARDIVHLKPYVILREATELAAAAAEAAKVNWAVADGKAAKARRAISDTQELYDGLQKELAKPDNTVLSFRLRDE